MTLSICRSWAIALACITLAACMGTVRASEDMRAIWITRWDYRTADDIREIVEQCDEAGFDTLLFQVRGNATAFYDSYHEPWAEELGGDYPGFDPLALALEQAHARGLRLHAWVNVMPAVWGTTPPTDPNHVWHTHPEWLWYDQHGEVQGLSEGFYASLNPCLPEVREYLVQVLSEVATRYAVDGLHLDYIRFPNEHPAVPRGSGLDYPRDARTVALFEAAMDTTPDEAPAQWHTWRTEQVTRLVRALRVHLDNVAPGVVLGAAVGADPERALEHHQDVEGWLREGLLDVVFPMNYTTDTKVFDRRLADWSGRTRDAQVVMGIMVSGGGRGQRSDQLREAARQGFARAVFGYHVLFDSRNNVLTTQGEAFGKSRAQLREEILPAVRSRVVSKIGG